MFLDRRDAGRQLAKKIQEQNIESPLLLALPLGGVPVAYEVSQELDLPMEVFIARKLGAPSNPEFAFGAIAEGGGEHVEQAVVDALKLNEKIVKGVRWEQEERISDLKAELRKGRELPPLKDRNVIIVDDGVATGSTALAAAIGARNLGAKEVYVAAPVIAERSLVLKHKEIVDGVIFLRSPEEFLAVGQWYEDFDKVSPKDVQQLLESYQKERGTSTAEAKDVLVQLHDEVQLFGRIWFAPHPRAWVVFVHGSGSSFDSSRNNHVAQQLAEAGYSSLLFDLLTTTEDGDRRLVFNIPFLAKRLKGAVEWLNEEYRNHDLDLFLFGASTGAAAALMAVEENPDMAHGVISRGGRPDLAGDCLDRIEAPVLLIVGDQDQGVIELNEGASDRLENSELKLVSGATHLFEEPGTLDRVIELTQNWLDAKVPPLVNTTDPVSRAEDSYVPSI